MVDKRKEIDMHKRVGDKGGDGTAEGYYGKVSEGLFTNHGLSEPWDLGRFTYFEVWTVEPRVLHFLGKLPEYRYILARVYIGGTAKKETEEQTEYPIFTNTVSNLVDEYINTHTLGAGLLPVRNMRSDNKKRLKSGCAPLNEEEIDEFKRLLRAKDPEKYKLSFL